MKLRLWICLLSFYGTEALAFPPSQPLSGRLFYTPAQRTMLVNARIHQVTDLPKTHASRDPLPESPPVSFDGVLTRSDGVSATRWINGRPHKGQPPNNVRSLKPGQTRAHSQVYESYQLLRSGQSVNTPDQVTKPGVNREAMP